jgi:hypothetical protein
MIMRKSWKGYSVTPKRVHGIFNPAVVVPLSKNKLATIRPDAFVANFIS